MRLQIYSDLHVEFDQFDPPDVAADVAVLAGDILAGDEMLMWAGQAFADRPVIAVLGNHEFYRRNLGKQMARLRESCPPNVHLLENEAFEIDGVRFLGCTLWTDYALFGIQSQQDAMEACREVLADHRVIYVDDTYRQRFQPQDAFALHVRSRRWLEAELAKPYPGKTVVVTHHGPHRGSVAPRYATDIVSAGFVSDLSAFMGKSVLWVHGHTHSSFDYHVDGTRVVCNPRGYPLRTGDYENPEFRDDLVVSI